MQSDRDRSRSLLLGSVLVTVAGVLMITATFLPWVALLPLTAEDARGGSRHEYSGWDLQQTCRESSGFPVCEIASGDRPRVLLPGAWTLVVGAALALMGVAMFILAVSVRRTPAWLLTAGWVATIATTLLGVMMFVSGRLAAGSTRSCGEVGQCPEILTGLRLVVLTPLLALGGMITLSVASSRRRDRSGHGEPLRATKWARWTLLTGSALVALAGALMIVMTFTPWLTINSGLVEGRSGTGRQDYSGWELFRSCSDHGGETGCVLRDRGISSEIPEVRSFTGAWTLAVGAGLMAVGIAAFARAAWRKQIPGWFMAVGWVAVTSSVLLGFLMRESASDIDFNDVGLVLDGLRFTYLTPWLALAAMAVLTLGRVLAAPPAPRMTPQSTECF